VRARRERERERERVARVEIFTHDFCLEKTPHFFGRKKYAHTHLHTRMGIAPSHFERDLDVLNDPFSEEREKEREKDRTIDARVRSF
jgi:hypothetical protein